MKKRGRPKGSKDKQKRLPKGYKQLSISRKMELSQDADWTAQGINVVSICVYIYIYIYINIYMYFFVYFILSRLLYLAFSANLGLLCMPHPGIGSLV